MATTLKMKLKEGAPSLSTTILPSWRTTATVSTELHARRAMGQTVAESVRKALPGPYRWGGRWLREGWAAYKAEREALLFILFLFLTSSTRYKVCQSGRKQFHERGMGIFFLLVYLAFILHCIGGAAVPPCRPVLSPFKTDK